ncbi:MAG: c-type cytochrome, partial [Chitinophagaceae bacterium]
KTTAGKDLVWRARTNLALPYLANIITDKSFDPLTNLKFFRAFDFYSGPAKQATLLSLLKGDHPHQSKISLYALIQLDTAGLKITPQVSSALASSLQHEKGSQGFLELVSKYKVKNQNQELLNTAILNSTPETKSLAIRLLMGNNGSGMLREAIMKDSTNGTALVRALGNEDDGKTKDFLQSVFENKLLNFSLRRIALQMYNNGWNGQMKLYNLVIGAQFPRDLDTMSERLLLNAWRQDVKQKALAFYHPGRSVIQQLPPVAVMLKFTGDREAGKKVFSITCVSCHQVAGSGINFGPDLSEIGGKLSREAIYEAVLKPDAGISFGYEGVLVSTKDGGRTLGYISSDTKDELAIKTIGGSITRIKKIDITSRKKYEHSLMPGGLVTGLKQQEVVDLVEYLAGLKKGA